MFLVPLRSYEHQLTMAFGALRYFSNKCNMLFSERSDLVLNLDVAWQGREEVQHIAESWTAASLLEYHLDDAVNEARVLWKNTVS